MLTNRQLKNMILPLIMEQFLLMLVGLADTFMVSYAGEAAVSGVSLVNSFNTIFIFLFTALASGGAVVVSQYIGNEKREQASESVSQLLMISTVFSVVIAGIVLACNGGLVSFLFGKVTPDVRNACITYLRISVYSYPALAIYNAGAALYRSIGKTSTTMYISFASNGIAQSIWSVAALISSSMGPAFITVIGQCMRSGWY